MVLIITEEKQEYTKDWLYLVLKALDRQLVGALFFFFLLPL
jgi:hypothetical protein